MTFVARMSRWMGAAAVAALLGFAPAPAHAQMPNPGSFDLTPFLGLTFGTGHGGASIALGGALAYNYSTRLAFEGEIAFLPDIEGATNAVDISVITMSVNAIYHFNTRSRFVPYAAAGLGLGRARFSVEGLADESHTEPALSVGGGVKTEWRERIMVRADLRYFNVNDESPNFWRLSGGVTFRFDR